MTSAIVGDTARAYIQAVGDHDLGAVESVLDDRLTAIFAGAECGKKEWIGALAGLLPVLLRNEIREVYVQGDRACVVYDFVTDTDAGAVRCVELVTVLDGRITAIELLLDRLAFAPVNQALRDRASQTE